MLSCHKRPSLSPTYLTAPILTPRAGLRQYCFAVRSRATGGHEGANREPICASGRLVLESCNNWPLVANNESMNLGIAVNAALQSRNRRRSAAVPSRSINKWGRPLGFSPCTPVVGPAAAGDSRAPLEISSQAASNPDYCSAGQRHSAAKRRKDCRLFSSSVCPLRPWHLAPLRWFNHVFLDESA
jgi:hypothetical protein